MSLPDFSPEEQCLVNYLKAPGAFNKNMSYMWGYLVGGIVVFGTGVYYRDVFVMVIGFALVAAFRLYEEYRQERWAPIYRRVIEKYEAALSDKRPVDQVSQSQVS